MSIRKRKPGRRTSPADLGPGRDRRVTIYLSSPALAERVKLHPGHRTIAEFGEKALLDYLAKVGG